MKIAIALEENRYDSNVDRRVGRASYFILVDSETNEYEIIENERVFKPIGIPMVELESVEIEIDELEAIRLCDYEGKSQIETAELMQISRGTVQRILNSGRKKILDALLHQKAIKLKNTGDEK